MTEEEELLWQQQQAQQPAPQRPGGLMQGTGDGGAGGGTPATGLMGILPPFRSFPNMPGFGQSMGGMQGNPSANQFVQAMMNQPGGSPFGATPPTFGTPWAFGTPTGLPSPERTMANLPPPPATPAAPAPGPMQPNYQNEMDDWLYRTTTTGTRYPLRTGSER